jgi:hypothetical protein
MIAPARHARRPQLEPLDGRVLLSAVPRPDHIVIVVEENHAYSSIIGSTAAPYINSLAAQGASFTASHGVTHPSQPNYIDLFSGSNQGVTSDVVPTTPFKTANLGAETWLRTHLDSYVQWAKTHNSLFIVTFDEDDRGHANRIPTIFVGPMVTPGTYAESINHYNVLRTVEDAYGLPYAGASASAAPITDVWHVVAAAGVHKHKRHR